MKGYVNKVEDGKIIAEEQELSPEVSNFVTLLVNFMNKYPMFKEGCII